MATNTKDDLAVEGYVRINFSNDCWVDEIIKIILRYYLIKSGSLYMFGDGKYGCLGIKEYFDKTLQVAVSSHTLILDIDGQVWSCGYGYHGQLGNGKVENVSTPQKLNLAHSVIAVAAGDHHSLILLSNGHVQSFGNGGYGALGHSNDENVLLPKTIEELKMHKIVKISAGGLHSFALAENNDLFCFGMNENDQCGVGQESEENIMIPTKIVFDKKVALVQCGAEHTLLITCDGLIYSFGNGDCGDLGHGCEKIKHTPTLIEALKQQKIKKCGAGFTHSICIDEDGIVWAFGDNTEGQCGLGKNIKKQLTPKVIEYFVSNKIRAKDCAAAGDRSSVISEDESLYVFGWDEDYRLGLSDAKNYTPVEISLPKNMSVIGVSASFQHTALISK